MATDPTFSSFLSSYKPPAPDDEDDDRATPVPKPHPPVADPGFSAFLQTFEPPKPIRSTARPSPAARPAGLARIPRQPDILPIPGVAPIAAPRTSHSQESPSQRLLDQAAQRGGPPSASTTTENLYGEPTDTEALVDATKRGIAGWKDNFGGVSQMVGRMLQPDEEPKPERPRTLAEQAAFDRMKEIYSVGAPPAPATGALASSIGAQLEQAGARTRERAAIAKEALPRPEYAQDLWSAEGINFFKALGISAIENLPQLVSTLGAAVATGPVGAIAVGGLQEAGGAYNEVIDSGGTEEEARRVAGWVAATNSVLEYLPAARLLRGLKGGANDALAKSAVRVILEQGMAEGGTESLQELNQVLANVALTAKDHDLTLGEVAKRVGEAGLTGFVLGLVGGAGEVAPRGAKAIAARSEREVGALPRFYPDPEAGVHVDYLGTIPAPRLMPATKTRPPDPMSPPKGEPLPLPKLDDRVAPEAVEEAWAALSSRYPTIASQVRQIRAHTGLPAERPAMMMEDGTLVVSADLVKRGDKLTKEVLGHELVHLAQYMRNPERTNEDLAWAESYAWRGGNALAARPDAPMLPPRYDWMEDADLEQTLADVRAQRAEAEARLSAAGRRSADPDLRRLELEESAIIRERRRRVKPEETPSWFHANIGHTGDTLARDAIDRLSGQPTWKEHFEQVESPRMMAEAAEPRKPMTESDVIRMLMGRRRATIGMEAADLADELESVAIEPRPLGPDAPVFQPIGDETLRELPSRDDEKTAIVDALERGEAPQIEGGRTVLRTGRAIGDGAVAASTQPRLIGSGEVNPRALPPAVDERQADRRIDAAARRRVDDMTPDEMRRALLTDDLTGLGNRRAWEESGRDHPYQAFVDGDGLKWINDEFGHDAGSQLLQAIGEAMRPLGGYRLQGDEYAFTAQTEAEIQKKAAAFDRALQSTRMRYTKGDVVYEVPVGATYGIGRTIEQADEAARAAKAEREAGGLRARRGERPPGLVVRAPEGWEAGDRGTETAASEGGVDESAPPPALAAPDDGAHGRDDLDDEAPPSPVEIEVLDLARRLGRRPKLPEIRRELGVGYPQARKLWQTTKGWKESTHAEPDVLDASDQDAVRDQQSARPLVERDTRTEAPDRRVPVEGIRSPRSTPTAEPGSPPASPRPRPGDEEAQSARGTSREGPGPKSDPSLAARVTGKPGESGFHVVPADVGKSITKFLRRKLTSAGLKPRWLLESMTNRDGRLSAHADRIERYSMELARQVNDYRGPLTPKQLARYLDDAYRGMNLRTGAERLDPVQIGRIARKRGVTEAEVVDAMDREPAKGPGVAAAPEFVPAVRKLRAAQDALTRDLRRAGLLDDGLARDLEREYGLYSHRQYEAVRNPRWRQRIEHDPLWGRAVDLTRQKWERDADTRRAEHVAKELKLRRPPKPGTPSKGDAVSVEGYQEHGHVLGFAPEGAQKITWRSVLAESKATPSAYDLDLQATLAGVPARGRAIARSEFVRTRGQRPRPLTEAQAKSLAEEIERRVKAGDLAEGQRAAVASATIAEWTALPELEQLAPEEESAADVVERVVRQGVVDLSALFTADDAGDVAYVALSDRRTIAVPVADLKPVKGTIEQGARDVDDWLRGYQTIDQLADAYGTTLATIETAYDDSRAAIPSKTENEILGILDSYMNATGNRPVMPGGNPEGAKDLSIVRQRGQVDDLRRLLRGEMRNVLPSFVTSSLKMAALLEQQRFLGEIAERGQQGGGPGEKIFYRKPERAGGESFSLQVDPDKLMAARETADGPEPGIDELTTKKSKGRTSPLGGLYTSQDILDELTRVFDPRTYPTYLRAIMTLSFAAKAAQTVGSEQASNRNFLSNFGYIAAHGVNPFNVRRFRTAGARAYGRVFQHLASRPSRKIERVVQRVFAVDPGTDGRTAREVGERLRLGLYDQSTGYGDLKRAEARSLAFQGETPGAGSAAGKFVHFLGNKYQSHDNYSKDFVLDALTPAYMDALGVDERGAVKYLAPRLRDSMQNYSRVPEGVRQVASAPLLPGPFLSFSEEVVRNTKNLLKWAISEIKSDNPKLRKLGWQKVGGLAIAWSLPVATGWFARYLLNMDDDDDEAVRKFMAPWNRNAQIMFLSRDRKADEVRFLDWGFMDAFALLKEPVLRMANGDFDGALESLSRPLSEDLVFQKWHDIARNTTETGGRVYNPRKPAIPRTLEKAVHLGKALEPGTMRSARRIADPPQGSRFDEVLALFGPRITTINIPKELGRRAKEYKKATGDDMWIAKEVVVHDEDAKDKRARAEKSAERQLRDSISWIAEHVAAARQLDVDEEKIEAALSGGGLARWEIDGILDGDIEAVVEHYKGNYEEWAEARDEEEQP